MMVQIWVALGGFNMCSKRKFNSPSGIKCFQNESVLPEEENYRDCNLEYSSV